MDKFIDILHKSIQDGILNKLKLINSKNSAIEFSQVIIKPVILKKGQQLSFVYRHKTKDVTKNYNLTKSILLIKEHLKNDFSQAIAFTAEKDVHFSIFPNGKTTVKNTKPSLSQDINLAHDKQKSRFIKEDAKYLQALGVTSSNGLVKAKMNGKYRQINKFIEIVDSFKKELKKLKSVAVADMGAGKGYLSFALYDYLKTHITDQLSFEAVELRAQLVEQGNQIANESKFSGLKFLQNDIQSYSKQNLDILIALHACDTATDDAIQKGIKSNASLIICSPCCHKQVRKDMMANQNVNPITKHGILKERQAEILTDTIRALVLEYFGYKTNVMEFISSEHTSKNLLITAVKDSSIELNSPNVLNQITELKSLFGITRHQLETLMLLDS